LIIRLTTCALLALLLTACGVKGNLQPKGRPTPLAPTALTLLQQGDEILLAWDIPTENQDGSQLSDLAGFRIGYYAFAADRFCAECRDQETIATINISTPEQALIDAGKIFYRDSALTTDTGHRYRVYPFTSAGKSGPAAEALRIMLPPPVAPDRVRIEALDQGARIFWSLPDEVQDTGDLIGINIYRGENNTSLAQVPINREPIKGNNFESFGLVNGSLYRFGLRTVVQKGDQIIESTLSTIVTATPQAGL